MSTDKYDVVVIGAGLGGLECGYILSKKGLKVCIVEKEKQAGGCLQTFRRGGALFDTGFHYVGGLGEGQALHRIFRYFRLLDLPWHQMDEQGSEEIILGGKSYMHATGYDRFVETLAASFPHQKENLQQYVRFLKSVGDNIFGIFDKGKDADRLGGNSSLFARSACEYVRDIFDDPQLISVLSGASVKLPLNPHKLPLYPFAQINNSYIESSWRLKGGGSLIIDRLAEQILSMGGTILTGKKVISLREQEGKIIHAILGDGEVIYADTFISDVHPFVTLDLIGETKKIRPVYRKRIQGLDNSSGMFTVNVKLKKDYLPYLNRNIHIHTGNDPWSYSSYVPDRKDRYVAVSYRVPEEGEYASGLDLLTPMCREETARWEETETGRRGSDYLEFKERKASVCIELASQYIPGLKAAVDKVYTSTPLTYRDYTGTINGSAYGIEKDFNSLMHNLIPVNTPVSNLFLTGQNLNVHGVLGVSMTSFLTCGSIVGMDSVLEDF